MSVQVQESLGRSVVFYRDYRAYLRDVYLLKKNRNHRWSYAVWARELSLRSPSTLVMILKGRRHPGHKLTQRLVKKLQLNTEETSYFCELIHFQKKQPANATNLIYFHRLNLPKRKWREVTELLDDFSKRLKGLVASSEIYEQGELVIQFSVSSPHSTPKAKIPEYDSSQEGAKPI